MTPTALAEALRNVEIANEETNLSKFQSDAAIVEEAAMLIEKQDQAIKGLRNKIQWFEAQMYGTP